MKLPPKNKLDPDQLRFLELRKTASRINCTGFAGTGKSVCLVYMIQEIYVENPDAKCCIVSFTHALLEVFKEGVEDLEIDKLIELNHQVNRNWEVLPFVAPDNICNAEEGQIDLVTKYEFKKNQNSSNRNHYDFIFIDEVQDVCPTDLHATKKSFASKIMLAGDENQSIYDTDPQKDYSTGEYEPTLSPGDIQSILNPVDHPLTYLHRLTPPIIDCVEYVMPKLRPVINALNLQRTDKVDVDIIRAEDEIDEVLRVFEDASRAANQKNELTAILFPLHGLLARFCQYICEDKNIPWNNQVEDLFSDRKYKEINAYFEEHGLPLEYVGNSHGSFTEAKKSSKIILMIYKSSKGQDFKNVFIPMLSQHNWGVRGMSYQFPRPFMVAMTRSNLKLTMSYSGWPLEIISGIEDLEDCFYLNLEEEDDGDDLILY